MKLVLGLCVFVSFTACWAGSAVDLLRQELRGLDTAHPESDAARDIASNSPHCYSVNGYGVSFPGVGKADIGYCELIEKNFKGTSDGVEDQEHVRLIETAANYAVAYNRYVLAHRN